MSFPAQNLTIKFYLYDVEKEKKKNYQIYARIIYQREKADISMWMTAATEDWDRQNQMLFPSSPNNRFKNNTLLSAKDEILKIFNRLKDDNMAFTVKTVRQIFRGQVVGNPTMKLLDCFDLHVNDCKSRPAEYGEGVIEHYRKTRRHLVNFMTVKHILNIRIKQLSRNFIVSFEQYLLSTKIKDKDYSMCRNTATIYLKKLKAVINGALKKELIDRNPFAGYQLPKIKTTKIVYLTTEEVDRIKALEFSGGMDIVRNHFLFCCGTGLRFSDSSTLREENIITDKNGMKWIRLDQKKTQTPLEVPMLEEAIKIYNLYNSNREETGFILPKMSHQKVNSYLKIIADQAGIKKHISHHTARHTFGTSLLERGVDLKIVSKLMGHTSIKSTEHYARVTRKNLADVIGKLNESI